MSTTQKESTAKKSTKSSKAEPAKTMDDSKKTLQVETKIPAAKKDRKSVV